MNIEASILISSFNRSNLLRRTLFSIATNKPSVPFEVILADDGSSEDIVSLLKSFNSAFPWKFISVDMAEFKNKLNIEKYHNNPSLTNNVAFSNSSGSYIFLMGNECICWDNAFNKMIEEAKNLNSYNYLIFSKTFDLPENVLRILDDYGANLTQKMVDYSSTRVLASENYCSDVTNYLSLCSRNLWTLLGGYDERYLCGVACEDSDFVRRARKVTNFQLYRSNSLSLHQFHNGMGPFSKPTERGMNEEKWNIGLKINRDLYNKWDGTYVNKQPWIPGCIGVKEVIENGY